MPCRDEGYDYDNYLEQKARADTLAQLLCALCEELELKHRGLEFATNNLAVAAWWKEHKELDKQRKIDEIERLEEDAKILAEGLQNIRKRLTSYEKQIRERKELLDLEENS